jgi:hypothetical protein
VRFGIRPQIPLSRQNSFHGEKQVLAAKKKSNTERLIKAKIMATNILPQNTKLLSAAM